MRVVFNLLDAEIGGGQRVAAAIAEALVAAGHGIGLAAPGDGPAATWFTTLGAPFHRLDLVSLRRPWGVAPAARAFGAYDLVYTHSSVPGEVLGGAAAGLARVPHVVHQHVPPHFSPVRPVAALQRRLYSLAAAHARTIAVAQHVADASIAAGAPQEKVFVIPNGVEIPERWAQSASGGPVTVGLLARLDPQKGIDVYLDAVGRSAGRARFLLGTPAPADDAGRQLHERARALGVEVVAPASTDFLDRLDVAVFPSRRAEGQPLTLMEAMARGKPIVATTVPGVPELVEGTDAALLVPPEDAAALAAAIARLVADGTARSRLGAQARELVSTRYALPVVQRRVVDLLERAADGA